MSRLWPAALLVAGCASHGLLEQDVDPGSAIRVDILDDLVLVDGNPVQDGHLRDAIAAAREARGSKRRCAALVSVALQPRDGESPVDFDARVQHRKQEVIDDLVEGGVRDLQLGPPDAPRGESKQAGR